MREFVFPPADPSALVIRQDHEELTMRLDDSLVYFGNT